MEIWRHLHLNQYPHLMKLSKNFTLAELENSAYATRNDLDNRIPESLLPLVQALVTNVLQPVRDLLKEPVIVSSGYRSYQVNKGVGGSPRSQHMRAEAADLVPVRMSVPAAFKKIAASDIPFDQLILEFGRWIHISHRKEGPQRRQVLIAKRENGRTVYEPFQPQP